MMKPKCKLIGKNGNIFNLMALAAKTLKEAGLDETEMLKRVMSSNSYMEALGIISEYVEIH